MTYQKQIETLQQELTAALRMKELYEDDIRKYSKLLYDRTKALKDLDNPYRWGRTGKIQNLENRLKNLKATYELNEKWDSGSSFVLVDDAPDEWSVGRFNDRRIYKVTPKRVYYLTKHDDSFNEDASYFFKDSFVTKYDTSYEFKYVNWSSTLDSL